MSDVECDICNDEEDSDEEYDSFDSELYEMEVMP